MKETSCDALMPVLTSESLIQFQLLLALLPGAGYLPSRRLHFFLGNNMYLRGGACALFAVIYNDHSQVFIFLDYVLSTVSGLIVQKIRHISMLNFVYRSSQKWGWEKEKGQGQELRKSLKIIMKIFANHIDKKLISRIHKELL